MLLHFNFRSFLSNGSYDIYDESGKVIFTIRSQISWGQRFKLFNSSGECVGTIKKKIPALTPRFEIYLGDEASFLGNVSRYYSMSAPDVRIDFDGWHTNGNCSDCRYDLLDQFGAKVAAVAIKSGLLTASFTVDMLNPKDELTALLLILALYAVLI